MAMNRLKYRRVTDLYVSGVELVLRGGDVLWLQVLNPFERDEAMHDAQVARSRVTLALKEGPSDELTKVRAAFFDDGRERAIARLVEAKRSEAYIKIVDELSSDEEWKEKIDLLRRAGDLATTSTPEELEYLDQLVTEYSLELASRVDSQTEFDQDSYADEDDESLWESYRDWWLDRRGSEIGMTEYRFTELWLAARVCDATKRDDGSFDHSGCDGHREHAFVDKSEVRHLPEKLQADMIEALAKLDMSEREAGNSDRQGSSSEPSPLPSVQEDSTPSTQAEKSPAPPGS